MTTAAASNHSPPPDKTTTSKTTSSQSFPNQATATKTKVDNCSSPKPCSTIEGHRDNTNERGRKELTPHSERGGKELTSHSDDWRTLSPTSPTPPPKHHMTSQTGHMTPETDHMTSQTGHMIQKTDHMTPATGHTTPANGHMTPVTDHMTSKGASGWTTPPTRASPVVPIPTPPHLRGTYGVTCAYVRTYVCACVLIVVVRLNSDSKLKLDTSTRKVDTNASLCTQCEK